MILMSDLQKDYFSVEQFKYYFNAIKTIKELRMPNFHDCFFSQLFFVLFENPTLSIGTIDIQVLYCGENKNISFTVC